MHIVFRIGFWLSLLGLGVALLAPLITSAASFAEAQPNTYIGLIAVFGFGIGSILTVPRNANEDPFDAAMRKRRGGIVYSLLAFLMMTGVGGIGEAVAQDSWRGDSSDSASSSSYLGSSEQWRAEDNALGTWTYLYSMLAGGVCFVAMIGFVAKKPKRGYAQPQAGQYGYPAYSNAAFAATQYPAHPQSYPPQAYAPQQYPSQPYASQYPSQPYAQQEGAAAPYPASYPPGAPLPSFAESHSQQPQGALGYQALAGAQGYYPPQQS